MVLPIDSRLELDFHDPCRSCQRLQLGLGIAQGCVKLAREDVDERDEVSDVFL